MSRWMLDLGVNREFQFSGMSLTQEEKKKNSSHNNVTSFQNLFFFLRSYYKGDIYSEREKFSSVNEDIDIITLKFLQTFCSSLLKTNTKVCTLLTVKTLF